jgi:hypothetical protein
MDNIEYKPENQYLTCSNHELKTILFQRGKSYKDVKVYYTRNRKRKRYSPAMISHALNDSSELSPETRAIIREGICKYISKLESQRA